MRKMLFGCILKLILISFLLEYKKNVTFHLWLSQMMSHWFKLCTWSIESIKQHYLVLSLFGMLVFLKKFIKFRHLYFVSSTNVLSQETVQAKTLLQSFPAYIHFKNLTYSSISTCSYWLENCLNIKNMTDMRFIKFWFSKFWRIPQSIAD